MSRERNKNNPTALMIVISGLILFLFIAIWNTAELTSEKAKRIELETTIETIYKYHPELLESHTHLDISVTEKSSPGFDPEQIIDSAAVTWESILSESGR